MNREQEKIGRETEKEVAKYLKELRYYALIIPKTVHGQPVDMIFGKNNIVWFVDIKHLENNKASFPFDRIESNQETAMQYAKIISNMTNLGFVIKWERDDSGYFFLDYDKFLELRKNGFKSVKMKDLKRFDEVLNERSN